MIGARSAGGESPATWSSRKGRSGPPQYLSALCDFAYMSEIIGLSFLPPRWALKVSLRSDRTYFSCPCCGSAPERKILR
jgi:hypothetical protein